MKKKIGVGCAALLLALVMVRVGAEVWGRNRLAQHRERFEREIKDERARIAAMRMPVLRGESVDDNAAPRYQKAIDAVDKLAKDPSYNGFTYTLAASVGKSLDADASSPIDPRAKRALDTLAPELAEIRAATHCTRVDWQLAYEKGFGAQIPSLLSVRTAACLLALEARDCANRGDWRGAVERLLDVERFGCDTASGLLISEMIAIATCHIGLKELDRTMARDAGHAVPYDQVAAELAKLAPVLPNSAHGLRGERMQMRSLALLGDEREGFMHDLGANAFGIVISERAVMANALDWFDEIEPEGVRIAQTVDLAERKKLQAHVEEITKSSWNPIVRVALPNYENLGGVTARLAATALVLETAAKIEAKRGANGAYPKDASEVELPSDPCLPSAKLHYAAKPGGFKLWSVGPSGVDHGGVGAKDPEKGDVVFEKPPLPPVEKKK